VDIITTTDWSPVLCLPPARDSNTCVRSADSYPSRVTLVFVPRAGHSSSRFPTMTFGIRRTSLQHQSSAWFESHAEFVLLFTYLADSDNMHSGLTTPIDGAPVHQKRRYSACLSASQHTVLRQAFATSIPPSVGFNSKPTPRIVALFQISNAGEEDIRFASAPSEGLPILVRTLFTVHPPPFERSSGSIRTIIMYALRRDLCRDCPLSAAQMWAAILSAPFAEPAAVRLGQVT